MGVGGWGRLGDASNVSYLGGVMTAQVYFHGKLELDVYNMRTVKLGGTHL